MTHYEDKLKYKIQTTIGENSKRKTYSAVCKPTQK